MKTHTTFLFGLCLGAFLPTVGYCDGTSLLSMDFTGKIINPSCLFSFAGDVSSTSSPVYSGGTGTVNFGSIPYSDVDAETPGSKSIDKLFSLDIYDCHAIGSSDSGKQMQISIQTVGSTICDNTMSVIPNIMPTISSYTSPVGIQLSYTLVPGGEWQTLSVNGSACPGNSDAARFNLDELSNREEQGSIVYTLPLKASLLAVRPWKGSGAADYGFLFGKGAQTLSVQFNISYY